jgi:uncharacterized repeat protein (TIGR03833 family)
MTNFRLFGVLAVIAITTILFNIMNGQNRSDIYPGLEVDIILKKDQRSGNLTRGIVKRLLTSATYHSRGIKVQLDDGQVGRVAWIVEED